MFFYYDLIFSCCCIYRKSVEKTLSIFSWIEQKENSEVIHKPTCISYNPGKLAWGLELITYRLGIQCILILSIDFRLWKYYFTNLPFGMNEFIGIIIYNHECWEQNYSWIRSVSSTNKPNFYFTIWIINLKFILHSDYFSYWIIFDKIFRYFMLIFN